MAKENDCIIFLKGLKTDIFKFYLKKKYKFLLIIFI